MTETIALKHLTRLTAGQSPSSDDVTVWEGDGLPFLQGNAEFGPRSPTPIYRCDVAPRTCHARDVLLSVRAPVGALNVADRAYGIGRGLCAVQPVRLHHRYAWWLMHGLVPSLQSMAVGSTYDAVAAEDVGGLRAPVMTMAQQRAIADFLDTETARIDALIAKKRRMIELLDERWLSCLDAAFAELTGYRVGIGRFVKEIGQGVSPQADGTGRDPEEPGVLKLSAVKAGRYLPSESKALLKGYPFNPSLVPRRGDILITRSNTPAYVGDACAVTEEDPYVLLPDLIYRVRVDARLDPEYAAYSLLTSEARKYFQSLARGTSQSMVKLRGEDVKACPLPVESLETQRSVANALDQSRGGSIKRRCA